MAEGELLGTILRLTLALVAGGLVGLERSYHGRPAGFREHTLVCISSCMLMLLAEYHVIHIAAATQQAAFIDPTRMAQGIMTGIGFLGAGAIVKEGFAIRGLTTAASIWMISAIGIMIGMGYYVAAGAATFATFNINYVFRLVESRMRSEFYAHFHVRFARDVAGPADAAAVRTLIKTLDKSSLQRLAEKLTAMTFVCEFGITPRSD